MRYNTIMKKCIKSCRLRQGFFVFLLIGVKIMAKGKYQKWLEPENLILLEGWARDGLTDEQIAHKMGIGYSTLKIWKSKYIAILAALKKGKEVIDYKVENALLNSALEGNTTAQIFWLKNRRPDKWRDKINDVDGQENTQTPQVNINISAAKQADAENI